MIFPALATVLLAVPLPADDAPMTVDPPDLTSRADLLGREVVVDGRVRLYQLRPSRGFDEVLLRESDAVFRLPPRLAYREAPRQRVAKIQGVLRREGNQYVVDVSSIQLLPEDHERLERGIAALAARDREGRLAWARWAARRGELYDDDELRGRARRLQTEALELEARTPDAQKPQVALDLARRAREQGLDESLASALAHRGFVAQAREAKTVEALRELADRVARFLPESERVQTADLSAWQAAYETDPFDAYRQASQAVRRALDRRLLAGILERELRLRAAADPRSAIALADEARSRLPDRPALAAELRSQGLQARSQDVSRLRRDEVVDLARTYEQNGQPQKGRDLIRAWLLQRRDAIARKRVVDERIQLAEDFLALENDRTSALELLREAAEIDPEARLVAEAFRRLGFRREGDRWVEAVPGRAAESASEAGASAAKDDPLLGLTPEEVVARLGKPDRKSQSVTQGRGMIQWVYLGNNANAQYVYFEKRPGFPPQVVARYTPR